MSANTAINKPPRDWSKWGLGLISLLIYGFLYLPIVVVILYSFSATKVNAWPIQGYTLDWYRELRADTEIRNAIGSGWWPRWLLWCLALWGRSRSIATGFRANRQFDFLSCFRSRFLASSLGLRYLRSSH
jgi:hypothetical protein